MIGLGILMKGITKLRTANTSIRLRLHPQTPLSIAKEAFGKQVLAAYVVANQYTVILLHKPFDSTTLPACVAGGISVALVAFLFALYVWYTRSKR